MNKPSKLGDYPAIEAAVFRRLIDHLDQHKEVQNIDLMILADFCRNCLARWYREAAQDQQLEINDAQARQLVYGMPYDEWKDNHQLPASAEQLAALAARNEKSPH